MNQFDSLVAGQKDFTVKVKIPGERDQYIIQRAPNPATAVMRIKETFPEAKCLVIDSRPAVWVQPKTNSPYV